jgi:hypothetical protein
MTSFDDGMFISLLWAQAEQCRFLTVAQVAASNAARTIDI